jgi:hypothetical protein
MALRMLQFDRTGTTFDDAVAPRAAGPWAVRIDPPPSPAQLVAAVAVQEMRFSTGRWGNPDRPSAVAGAIRPRRACAGNPFAGKIPVRLQSESCGWVSAPCAERTLRYV